MKGPDIDIRICGIRESIEKLSIIALLLLLTMPQTSAEPLIISSKVTPDKPKTGDTVGVYIVVQGLRNESIQAVSKLKDTVFKVVDLVTGEDVPFSTIKQNAIDFQIERGQTLQITLIGELREETLLVLFPNAFSVKLTDVTPTRMTPIPEPELHEDSALRRLFGELQARYHDIKDSIPERMEIIIEQKFRNAESLTNAGQFEQANAILSEIEGMVGEFEKKKESESFWTNASIVALIIVVAAGSFIAWKFYTKGTENREREEQEQEERTQATNFELFR